MDDFADLLRRMRIHVESADRTVVMTATGDGRLAVVLADGALARHTHRSLTHQVEAVVRAAPRASRRGVAFARQEAIGEPDPAPVERSREPDGFTELLRTEPLSATSRRGYVTVSRDEHREIRVRIEPAAMARLDAAAIGREITDALHAALLAYDQLYVTAHRRAYGDTIDRLDLG